MKGIITHNNYYVRAWEITDTWDESTQDWHLSPNREITELDMRFCGVPTIPTPNPMDIAMNIAYEYHYDLGWDWAASYDLGTLVDETITMLANDGIDYISTTYDLIETVDNTGDKWESFGYLVAVIKLA